MTFYATGVRNAELTHLKFSDLDSKRMVIHIQGAPGRYVPKTGVRWVGQFLSVS